MSISARVSPARRAAFDALLHVETRDSFAAELLHSNLLTPLTAVDRALTTELVMGVLRWQMMLDDALQRAGGKSIVKFDPEVKIALRLGAYQLLFLDRIPARAAVNESVELVKLLRKRSAAPLVNAVLRKVSGPSVEISIPDTATRISDQFSHPLWIVERWVRNYGIEAARRTCEYNQQRPRTIVRLARAPRSPGVRAPAPACSGTRPAEAIRATSEVESAVLEELAQEGVELEPTSIVTGAWRLVRGDLTQTTAYREHRLAIQDEAAQLVGLLAQGRRILDCCAAPGGKSAIAEERNAGSLIVSMDLHPHRVRLMRELTGSRTLLVADACHLPFAQSFDCVIADLPCTGTGTLSRNPEIKWRLRPDDPSRLAMLQLEMLRSVGSQARSIAYSTCSLEPEEGEEVIEQFLATHQNFSILPMANRLKQLAKENAIASHAIETLIRGKFLRTIPGIHGCDGFFAAVLQSA